MDLPIHTMQSAPADARPILDGIVTDLGFVPNLAAAAATSPALLAGFDGLRRAVASGKLDPVLREVAGLAAGVAIENHYGVAFHSTVLARLGLDDTDIDALRTGRTPASEAAAAVQQLARDVVVGHGKLPGAHVTRAMHAGLTVENILEVVLECTFANLVGTIDNLADRVELDDFLAPRAWAR